MQTRPNSLDRVVLQALPEVPLYPARGRVLSLRDFANTRAAGIDDCELDRVRAQDWPDPPDSLARPLVRSAEFSAGPAVLVGRRSGARSALWTEESWKLKGCRPTDAEFPAWKVDADFRLTVGTVPFGTLTREAVSRELLGATVLSDLGLPLPARPVAVMAYERPPGTFCMVLAYRSEERLEARLDDGGLTVHQLVRLARHGDPLERLGREMALQGLSAAAYVSAKAELLAELQAAGGRRGILNSNIGNDVVDGAMFVGICDFDTFHLLRRPVEPAADRSFVLSAALEALKSSLPIVDYVEPTLRSEGRPCPEVARRYLRASTWFAAWLEAFAKACGVEKRRLLPWIDELFALERAGDILDEIVPNAETLRTFTPVSSYVPHC